MPDVTLIYGTEIKTLEAEEGALIGDVIAKANLPLEQPCAGRGTCGKCKVLVEIGATPPDEIEITNLSDGEIALNNRLACRARVQGETRLVSMNRTPASYVHWVPKSCCRGPGMVPGTPDSGINETDLRHIARYFFPFGSFLK